MTKFVLSLAVICLCVLTVAGCGDKDQPAPQSHERPQFTELPFSAQPAQPQQDVVSSTISTSETNFSKTTTNDQTALPESVSLDGHLGDALQIQGMNDDSGNTFWLISGKITGLAASPALSRQLDLTKARKIALQGQGKCTFSQETFLLSATGSDVLIQLMTNGGSEATPACALFVSRLQFQGLKADFTDVPALGYSDAQSGASAVSLNLAP